MTVPAALTYLLAFLSCAAGALGWIRNRRGDAMPDDERAFWQRLQSLGPTIGTLAMGVAIALHAAGSP